MSYRLVRHRLGRRRLLGSLLAAGAGTLLQACERSTAVVKIGVAQPLSGNGAVLGQDLLNGVVLAVEELNRQGRSLQGHPLQFEIVSADDGGDPQTGRAVAYQLIDAGVVAVIGHLQSGVSLAAAPIYAARNLAQLSISTHVRLTQLGFPGLFRLVANDELQARAMAGFSTGQLGGALRVAVLDDGAPWGRGLAGRFIDLLKTTHQEVVLSRSLAPRATDFADLVAGLKAARVDTLVSAVDHGTQVALIEALQQNGCTGLSLLGGDAIKTRHLAERGHGIQALYATSPVLNLAEFPGGTAFSDKFQARFGQEPAYGAHYTYDAMFVLASAIARTRSARPAEVIAQLKSGDGFAPVTGTMRWDARGEPRYGAVGVYRLRDGAWELQIRSDVW